MKLNKGDFIWFIILLLWILMLVVPYSRDIFMDVTGKHPYIGGFFKYAILATMGDLLGMRIIQNKWILPIGFIYKAIIWGILGIIITLIFTVFSAGTAFAQSIGRLPFENIKLATAFFTSFTMNATFGPMLYVYHKFADLFVDLKYENPGQKVNIKQLVDRIDWYSLVSFSWLKTCLLIWTPLHTIVFLLPDGYRVVVSAFLAILLGVLISWTKKKALENQNNIA